MLYLWHVVLLSDTSVAQLGSRELHRTLAMLACLAKVSVRFTRESRSRIRVIP